MANTKIRATAELFLNTKNAKNDAKVFIDDLKQKLHDIETAADKMTVFKDMVAYIAQVDRAMAALKANNQDAFAHMFDGLDTNLKAKLEGIFGVDGVKLGKLDVLREQLGDLTLKSSIKDVRAFAKEINTLFTSIGMDAPFNNIDEIFSGRTSSEHLKKLGVELANFATVWEDVNSRVSKGFGGSGGGIFDGSPKPSAEIQKEIDKLQQQKIKFQETLDALNGQPIKITVDSSNSISEFQKILDEYEKVQKVMSSTDYRSNAGVYKDKTSRDQIYAERIRLASLIQSYNDYMLDYGNEQEAEFATLNMRKIDGAIDYLNDFYDLSKSQTAEIRKMYSDLLVDVDKQLSDLKTSANKVTDSDAITSSSAIKSNIDDIGAAAEGTKKKVDILAQSIREAFVKATELELSKSKASETMSLFRADGTVSNAVGKDMRVDTDTIVGQLVSNLRNDLVMSLHNHANGNDMFSPQDLESFAKLYYPQGSKINGIITDGMIKTIDFTGISQELAIKISQSYAEGIQSIVSKNSNLLTYKDGHVDYTDFAKQLEIADPNMYKEMVLAVQSELNECLNNAFVKNGVQPTIQQFEHSQIGELANKFSDIQSGAEGAISPVEKLKNLLSTMYPDKNFNWNNYTEIFKQFNMGAIDGTSAIDKILNLDSIDSQVEQAKAKLESFLSLSNEIKSKSFNETFTATDNVEIGQYTERLDVAVNELERLGNQGLLTAEQLESVSVAYKTAMTHLDGQKHTYDGYGSGYGWGDADSSDVRAAEEAARDAQARAEKAQSESLRHQESANRLLDEKNGLQREIDSLRDQVSQKTTMDGNKQLTQSEISELDVLRQKLIDVKSAVDAKTRSFEEEYVTVDAAIDAEIASLQELINKLNEVIAKATLVGSSLKNIGDGELQIVSGKITETTDNVAKTPEEQFKQDKTNQLASLTKYINSLKEVDYVSQETRERLVEMRSELDNIKTPLGLKQFKQDLESIKKEVELNKSVFEITNNRSINTAKNKLINGYNNLNPDQQRKLSSQYKEAIKQLEQYKIDVQNGKEVEISAINEVVSALQQKINAYKEANKEAAKPQKNYSKFGNTAIINATAKYNSLSQTAKSDMFANSDMVKNALAEYERAYNAVLDKQAQLSGKNKLSLADESAFKAATNECNKYARALEKIMESSLKLHNTKANKHDYILGDDFNYSNIDSRKAALSDFAQQMYGVSLAATDFKDNYNKAVFAVDNGDGTFTRMTATFTDARNEIVAMAGETKKVQSAFGQFMDGFKGKFKSLSQYFMATMSIYRVWRVIKQGVTYVTEIDTALTELKKVTDETDASYSKFLQSMSKTGKEVGATVKELTTIAADWARLGYSMEESGKLAESTAVLLNVSEFDDATKASEALISTMQAFQYTADESGHVVDILNEVGNNYAVSSDGIATALQDSASALMAGGNSLEQAVALVASANKVVQDPNSVGSALRTISLRLRGTSVKVLEEMGEETEGVVESTSKLQAKIKALSGVDILTNAGNYKDTYTILKEIGNVWEEMSDIDQAALLELMAGKNRANTLSAILSNMTDLEGAYESALNAEGSALKENEAYLDSIQGRIDLFNNSVQTMWMNFLDSEAIKFIVNIGTGVIGLIDKFGVLKTILAGVFTYFNLSKKIHFDWMSMLGLYDLKANKFTFGKHGLTGWMSNALNSKKQKNIVQQVLGDPDDIKVSAQEFAVAISDNINDYTRVDTSQIDTEIENIQNKLMIARQGLDAAKKADLNYYKSLGSNAPSKDRNNRIAQHTQEIKDLETRLTSLQAKRDEIIGSAVKNVSTSMAANVNGQVQQYQSMLSVLQKVQGVQLSMGNEQDAAIKIDAMSKAASDGQQSLANYVSTLGDADIALKAYAASVQDGNYSLAGFQKFIQQHNAGLEASGIAAKASAIAHQFFNTVISIGMSMLASLLINGVVKFIDYAIQTTDELVDAWDEVKTEVKNINSELADTQKRIEELESKGTLSLVDKQELQQLRQTNDELERRKRILEDEEEEAASKARASVKNDYERFVKPAIRTQKDADVYNEAFNITEAIEAYQLGDSISSFTDAQINALKTKAPEIYNYMATTTWMHLDSAAADAINETYDRFNNVLTDLEFFNQPDVFVSGETYIDQAIQKIQEYKDQLYDVNGTLKDNLDDQFVVDINANIDDLESDLIATASELYEYMDNYGGNADDPFVQKLQEQIDKIDMAVNPVEFYNKKFDDIFGTYSQQKVSLYELSEQGKLTAASLNSSDYTPLMNELSKIGITAQDVADHINSLTEAQKKQVIDPVFSIADYSEGIDSIQEKISEYQSALQSLEDGSFTYSDFIDLTQKFPELADGVDTSSKSFNGLAKNLRKALRSSPEDLIKDLKNLREQLVKNGKATDSVDQLIDSLENLPVDAVADLSSEYVTLTDQINAAKKAQTELQDAMSENPNEGYETRGEAMEYMKDKMKRGEIGSESELWSVAEEYGFASDIDDINQRADALANFIAIREKWYKTDDDGNYTYEGTEDFIQSVENAVQSEEFKTAMESMGLALEDFMWAYDDATGQLDFDFDNANWDSIVSALSETSELAGLTSEEFNDLLVQIGQYFNVEWENNEDIVDHLSEIASGASDAKTKMEEYGKVMQQYFGADTTIDLTNRPRVSQTNMRGAGWKNFSGDYATVYSSTYSNEDGTKSVVVTPILPNGGVLSPEQLESYANDLLEGKEISPNVNIKLAEFEGEDSIQQAEEYAQALHDAQEEYFELRDYINKQLEEDTQINLESGLTDDSLKSIQTLVSTIHDEDTGVTWLSIDELKDKAQEAGMDVDTLTEKITELQNAGKIIDLKTTEDDPLGLESMTSNAETTLEYLQLLGLTADGAYEQIMQLGGFSINLPNFVDLMVQNGWDTSQISAYIQTLNSQGYTFTYTTEENKTETLDVNTTDGQTKVDELVASSKALTTTETLTVNLDGTAEGAIATIKSQIDTLTSKIHTVKVHISQTGSLPNLPTSSAIGGGIADGTAHALGTAYKGGSWGAPKTETALVGELGPELLVRNGMWTTIGDNGAEFTQIKKGDIIFNHKQTEDLLSKGYVTGRGKLHGGAFASGTAYPIGSGTFGRYEFSGDGSWKEYDVNNKLVDSMDGTTSALSEAADALSDASDEFSEVFDWIEVRLEEINDQLNLQNARLSNAVGADAQNKLIDDMIATNKDLYNNLIAGSNEYYRFAEQLLEKIPEEYRDAAQDGTIAIESFIGEVDEETLDAIQNYREWVQKGDEAVTEAENVLNEISTLAKEAFDNIVNAFENQASLGEGKIDQYEAYNDFLETDTGYASEAIYQAQIDENNAQIALKQDQRDEMQAELNKRVESGEITVGSDAWYEAVNEIAAVDTEIINLQTDNENLQDSINDLHFEKFDDLMERIRGVSEEANNIIDILSNEDMTDESGNWTDEGLTTLGMHVQNMEVAEYEAQKLAEEIAWLDENWRALGMTEEEYLERRGEMQDQQYDAINKYYEEKDAIVDLNKERVDAIKDGIEKEIEAYEELINKKKEELDAEKDLYDFQKSVMEQEKNIADLERQLAALSGDNSASARAKRAQLEAELAEAQAELQDSYYERSISNQQEALDKELENFQDEKDKEMEGWDKYLENTEQVVADSLETVQANTETVYTTLQAMGEEYSLSLSEALTSPWQEGSNAIQAFSEQFGVTASATVDELNNIVSEFASAMEEIAQSGNNAVDTVQQNMNSYTEAEYQEPAPEPEPEPAPEPEPEPEITVGGKIDATGAKIYDYAGDTSGENQYFAYDPIYTVLQEKDGYLLARWHKSRSGAAGWFKKSDVKAFAKGTKKLQNSGLVNIDELGEELVLRAQNGRLTYMEKGSGIIPADLTSNLMEWGALDPSSMLEQNRPSMNVHPEIHNTEVNLSVTYGDVLHIEEFNGDNPEDIAKIVAKQFEKHTKDLNNALRKFVR